MKRFRFDWCLNSCYTCQPIRALRALTPFTLTFFFVFHPDVPTSLSPRTLRSITSIDRRKWRRWSKSCSTRPPELHFDPPPLAFPTLPERTSSSTNTQHLLSLLSPCLCVMNVLYKAMNMMYLCKWAVPAQHFKLIKGTLWIGPD